METTLHLNEFKFHQPGKWGNDKNCLEDWLMLNLKKIYGIWIAFCCFAFKTKLIYKSVLNPLKNTYELKYKNYDLQKTWRFVDENLTVQAIVFQKMLSCASLCHKDFKKHLLIKASLKKFLCIHLQTSKVRSKTVISLEITLNVFKCLVVSLVLLKFSLWQQHHFCLFQLMLCLSVKFAMVPGVYILLCPQKEVHSSSWKHRYTHSAAQSSKKI